MKYRIVKNGLDEYYIQCRQNWWPFWYDCDVESGIGAKRFKSHHDAGIYIDARLKREASFKLMIEASNTIEIIEYL